MPDDSVPHRKSARGKRLLLGGVSLLIAATIWLSTVHYFFAGRTGEFFVGEGVAPGAGQLASRHIALWEETTQRETELRRMRATNPEWDFMWRTFFALSLANMALREPTSRGRYLKIMDEIIEDTLRREREDGPYYFLMPYARLGPFIAKPERSHFVDGEIALVLATRRLVTEHDPYRPLLAERVEIMIERMRRSPVLSAESYPDECWLFCNTVSLAAIRMHDILDGQDHRPFLCDWVRTAKEKLVEPKTGLLLSAYSLEGKRIHGPEGSSIWMAAHCLELVDRALAEDQYRRAKKELGDTFLGFGFSREWPRSVPGDPDVDAGAVIPVIGASTGASGMAFIAAGSFGDHEFLSALLASVRSAGLPIRRNGELRFAASNLVGDAVLLYAATLGPLWREVVRRGGP